MSAEPDDDDLEAEFQRELAALKAAEPDGVSNAFDSDAAQQISLFGFHVGSTSGDDTAEEEDEPEPESLRVMRQAWQRREEQLHQFGEDLEATRQQLAAGRADTADEREAGTDGSAPKPAARSPSAEEAHVDDDDDDAHGAISTDGFLPSTSVERSALVRCLFPSAPAAALSSNAAQQRARRDTQGGTSDANGTPQLAGRDTGSGGSRADGSSTIGRDAQADPGMAAGQERLALFDEYRANAAMREALRERMRLEAEQAAASEAAAAAERLQRLEEQLERQRQEALAALAAEAALAAAQHEAELARSAAEAQRQSEEAAALRQRMEEQEAAVARRQAEREQVLEQLRKEFLVHARRHMAAWRIARAWRRYRRGPARAARHTCAARIQAAWRGCIDRRRAAHLRAQRDLMRGLEEAASKGMLEALKELEAKAQGIGLESAVQQRVAALEAQAREAADKLTTAAQQGGAMAFKTAVAAAQRLPHLALLVSECSEVFAKRRSSAEAALQAAAGSDQPLAGVTRLCEAAGQLGVEPGRLTAFLDAARRRDATLGRELLAAASAAPFDLPRFNALADRAARLALKADIAAANHVLEKRRRALAAEMLALGATRATSAAAAAAGLGGVLSLHSLAAQPPSLTASSAARLCTQARAFGMDKEAAALEQRLQQKQLSLQAVIERSAEQESARHHARLLRRAEVLGMAPAMLQSAQSAFARRQQAAQLHLAAVSSSGTLHQFLEARGCAIRAGCPVAELLAADRQLAARRAEAAAGLPRTVQGLTGACNMEQPATCRALAGVVQALAPALGLGDPQEMLKRVERDFTDADAAETALLRQPQPAAAPDQAVQPPGSTAAQQAPAVLGGGSAQGQGAPSPGPAASSARQQPGRPPPADALGHDPPPQVLASLDSALAAGMQPRPGADAAALRAALGALWRLLVSSLQLGLPDSAVLALTALQLKCSVGRADGSLQAAAATFSRDYWGALDLASWEVVAAAEGRGRSGPTASGASGRGMCADAAAQYVWDLVCAGAGAGSLWAWPAVPNPLAMAGLWRACLPQLLPLEKGSPRNAGPRPSHQAAPKASHGAAAKGRAPPTTPGVPLTRALLLRTVPGATPASLACLVKLDVSLEQLSSLAGLDVACPALQVLQTSVNQLTDLRGLEGLTRLQGLSLKSNALAAIGSAADPAGGGGVAPGLPRGAPLRWLAFDANRLADLAPLSPYAASLEVLSCSDNALTGSLEDVGLGAVAVACPPPAAVAVAVAFARLRVLSLQGNGLTSLEGLAERCPALQVLDVSRNRLASLEGVQGCVQLQSLSAATNAIAEVPHPLALPCLRTLDLGQNALTAFGAPREALLPSLERLVLQGNQLSSLGALTACPGLTFLDVSFNALEDLACVQALACLTGLVELQLTDNPMTRGSAYRPAVLAALPTLHTLDHDPVPRPDRAASAAKACCSSPAVAVAAMRALRAGKAVAGVACAAPRGAAHATATASSTPAAGGVHGSSLGLGAHGVAAVAVQLAQLAAGVHQGAGQAAVPGRLRYATCYRPQTAAAAASADAQVARGQQHASGGRLSVTSEGSCRMAGDWLERTEQIWQMDSAVEAAATQGQELAVAQRLHPGQGHAACGVAVPLLQPAATPPQAAAPLRAVCMDSAPLRGFAGLAKALQGVSFGRPAAGPHNPAAPGEQQAQAPSLQAAAEHALAQESQYGNACRTAAQAHLSQLQDHLRTMPLAPPHSLAGPGGSAADATAAAAGQDALLPHTTYFLRRLDVAASAAAVIQAHWRGRTARCQAAHLRSEQYRQRRVQAAIVVQAWGRGHAVRCSAWLAAARKAAAAEREAARQEALVRQTAAATTIQAFMRGRGVRTKLKAARSAAKYADDDEDLDFGELDDMLDALKPLEQMLQDEPGPTPYQGFGAAAGMSLAQPPAVVARVAVHGSAGGGGLPLLPLPQRPLASVSAPFGAAAAAAAPGGGGAGAVVGPWMVQAPVPAAPLAAQPNSLVLASPAAGGGVGHLPPLRGALGGGSHSSALPPLAAAAAAAGPRPAPLTIWEAAGDHPGSLAAQHSHRSLPPQAPGQQQDAYGKRRTSGWGGSDEDGGISASGASGAYGHGHGYGSATPSGSVAGSQVSPGASQEEKQQRHLEKLQKLMAEWGFTDLATAEAFYRRTLRQKQGDVRRKLEAKFKDPSARMQKLRDVVDHRPVLRQQDVARVPPHAANHRPLPLHHGALQGPPSRNGGGGGGGGAANGGDGPGGGGGAPRPPRALSSADGALLGQEFGLSAGLSSGPPLHRSNSHGSAGVSALSAPAAGSSYRTPGGSAGAALGGISGGGGSSFQLQPARTPPPGEEEDRLSVRSFHSAGAAGSSGNSPSHALLRKSIAAPQSTGRPLLPSLANNWVMSPSQTPPGTGAPGGGGGRGSPALSKLEILASGMGISGGSKAHAGGHVPPLGAKGGRPSAGAR